MTKKPVTVLGAASNIGIRPYDDRAAARRLDEAPGVLRALGLARRLGAQDMGDVLPPPYRDFRRPPGGVRNESEVEEYSRALGDRVAEALSAGRFALVVGGDCSIVLGSLLGARRRAGRLGLAYIDAHADFATPQESLTGSAASMCLAMVAGRGETPLARLGPDGPLVSGDAICLVGRRDAGQDYYGHAALARSGVLDLPEAFESPAARARAAGAGLERLTRRAVDGFWIHLDADVLDPRVMPAVDSPEPGGPGLDELAALVAPLAQHPMALGLQVTIYDPALDPDRTCGSRLVSLLEHVLAGAAGGHP